MKKILKFIFKPLNDKITYFLLGVVFIGALEKIQKNEYWMALFYGTPLIWELIHLLLVEINKYLERKAE